MAKSSAKQSAAKKSSTKNTPKAPNKKSKSKTITKGYTLAHVTHEAVEQIGGIGTVLEGLMTSPQYKKRVNRSILIGPMGANVHVPNPSKRLGEMGKVLYSSIDGIDELGLAAKFQPIEWAFGVSFAYGTRHYDQPSQNRKGEAEVLLIDVTTVNEQRTNVFKARLWEEFGLDSARYQSSWDYEEYVRIAEPAFYALNALLPESDFPCVLFSHEFMGMPAALKCILDGGEKFRTIYHAHECPTARRLCEVHPGHDTMFYSVLDAAKAQGLYVEDVFGNLDDMMRHALVKRTHLLDGIIAVGDRTRDEIKFLSEDFDDKDVTLVYNGLPAHQVDLKLKNKCRRELQEYSQKLLGFTPDILMTHVARPVISKAIWRDLQVCHEMEPQLEAANQKAVLYILTSAGGTRSKEDVKHMFESYGWPLHHKEGYPDLCGPEIGLAGDAAQFNLEHKYIKVVLVNQFGWGTDLVGPYCPKDLDMSALRIAVDVEFGIADYEPFGISPLEPLACGAICVISDACGCAGFVQHTQAVRPSPT
ncbi:MAG: hypothetical protein JKX85_00095 [Phycisphaeraceae bacterium]|nr:hypothetical protein [Phycisphaeraceae bacterium]